MSKDIWRDCEKQPPLVDDGELVLMDSEDRFWVGFCGITSDGVSYFANNAEPLKNDFVKYARIEKLLAAESELERTRKALDVAVDALNKINMRCQNTVRNHLERATIRGELCDISFYARKAIGDIDNLERITALEQKDK